MGEFASSVRVLAFGLACLLVTSPARAEPSEDDRATARTLMDRGDALIDAQKYSEALEAYRQAHALVGVPTTGIEVARTLAKLGRILEARRFAAEIEILPIQPGEPAPFEEARREARRMVHELDSRVPRLTIKAPGAQQITVDGRVLEDFRAERTLQLEPGNHVVVAGRGNQSETQNVSLAERDRTTVAFKIGVLAKPPLPAAPRRLPEEQAERKTNILRTVGWVGVGVGAAGLVFGGVTGGMALQSKSKLDDGGCEDRRCPTSKADDVDRYNTLRTLSGVGLIGGAIVAAAGPVLVGFSAEDSQRERGQWRGTSFTF